MTISTYTELQSSIADYLERDDLTAYIPDFIRLAETDIRSDLRVREMIVREPITIDALQVELPSNYLESTELRLLTDPVTVLQQVTPHELSRYRRSGTGKPAYFTIHTEIEFDVNPDASYSGEMIYYKSMNFLSDTDNNTLLTNFPNVYLFGALKHSEPFLMNDERVATWAAFYEQTVKNLKKSSDRSRRSGPLISRVTGSTP
jgi:hypothetical protein